MNGHVARRGGSWQLKVYIGRDPLTGRKRYASKTVKASGKREADRALAAFVTELDTGKVSAAGSFGELLEKWFAARSSDWSPTTAYQTRWIIDRRLSGLRSIDVRKLGTADLDAFYGALRARGGAKGGPLSPSSVARVHGVVRLALAQAVAWGWRSDNPATLARPGKLQPIEIRPPTAAEVAMIAEAAAQRDPELLVYVALEAETGARRGEIAALRWSDLDGASLRIARSLAVAPLDAEILRRYAGHVWPAEHHRGNPTAVIEKVPKNRKSLRTIALSAGTASLLADHHRHCAERALASGVTLAADGFVFAAQPDGSRPVRPDTWTHRFCRLRDGLGLGRVRLHDLRHFVATTLLAAGVDLATVAGRLGHGGGGKTTLAVYAHFLEGGASDRAAAELLAKILSSSAAPEAGADAEVIPLRRGHGDGAV